MRCIECRMCETCPYSATRLYLKGNWVDSSWSAPLVAADPDIENVTKALQEGPYGICLYECDNDVCDHQVVNVEFCSGATATMTMVATTKRFCKRETKVYGSLWRASYLGEMRAYCTHCGEWAFCEGRGCRELDENDAYWLGWYCIPCIKWININIQQWHLFRVIRREQWRLVQRSKCVATAWLSFFQTCDDSAASKRIAAFTIYISRRCAGFLSKQASLGCVWAAEVYGL